MNKYIFNIRWESNDENVLIKANSIEEARVIVKSKYPKANWYTFLRISK